MMDIWQKRLSESITNPEQLAHYFPVDSDSLMRVTARYPMQITPYYLSLIEEPGDPIWRQCVPDLHELEPSNLLPDPLNEEILSPVPGVIHRYPDRVVLLVSSICAVYCRFCLRKRQVGCQGSNSSVDLDRAIDYIAANSVIRDVILSGGDPLLLSDERLEAILLRLKKIAHVQIVRIGTRVPVTLPERITFELCTMLKRYHPLYVNTHFNHPREITPQAAVACGLLADAGIQLGNQSVLLKGVNDDMEVMRDLVKKLLTIRVRPYYIHQMDLVQGTGHFRTGVRRGVEIMAGLRGHTSGLATPYYVIDAPGGKGKVPILPNCTEWRGNTLILTNYEGDKIEYPDFTNE